MFAIEDVSCIVECPSADPADARAYEDGHGDGPSGSKRRFDDTEYIEQSKELVDGVRSAVTAGTLSTFTQDI